MTVATKAKTRKRAPNYSPAFRAAALAALDANGGNVKRTARELGLKWQTLDGWRKGRRAPVPEELHTQKRAEFDTVLEDFCRRLCGVDVDKIKGLNLRDLGVALGIGVEKLLLLRGQPNAISQSQTATATLDLSQLSIEELRTLIRLQEKAGRVPPLPMAADLDNPVIVTDEPAPHAAE